MNRGEQVLAVDLLFTGDAAPNQDDFEEFPVILATTGDRALGIEAAQVIALAHGAEYSYESFGVCSGLEGSVAKADGRIWYGGTVGQNRSAH